MKVKVAQSYSILCDPKDYTVHGILQVRILELVAFPFSRESSQPRDRPHCRQILYQLSHKGSPTILEWVAYPFSSGSSWPRDRTGVFCIAGGFFTNWAIREALSLLKVGLWVRPSELTEMIWVVIKILPPPSLSDSFPFWPWKKGLLGRSKYHSFLLDR